MGRLREGKAILLLKEANDGRTFRQIGPLDGTSIPQTRYPSFCEVKAVEQYV
jgi:hypothetical protein